MKVLTYQMLLEKVSYYAAFLLFPGFFFYHTILGIGLMPPILGGFFTPVAIIILIIYLLIYFIFKTKLTKSFLLYFTVFLCWTLYVLFQYVIQYKLNGLSLLNWSLIAIIINTVSYMIMVNFTLIDKKVIRTFTISLIIMCLIIFYYSNNGRFYLKADNGIDGVASYQGFARSLLFVCYVCYVSYNRLLMKITIMIFSIVVLFMNTARSELIFFVLSILMLNIINYRKDYYSIAIIFIMITLIVTNFDYILSKISHNRVFELLDIKKSTSYEGREEFGLKAWQVIQNHPILGDYGYYIDAGGLGGYAHNILSAWAEFGIVGFLIFIGISLYLFVFSLNKIIFKNSTDKYVHLLFLFSSTLFLGYLTAKNYSYIFFGLSIGLYVNHLNSKRNMGIL